MYNDLNIEPNFFEGAPIHRGRGCERCNNTGYKGRTGIYELMVLNDDMRDLIMNNASTDQLRVAARRANMMTLREAGLRAIYEGHTTIDEVVRETVLEEEMA